LVYFGGNSGRMTFGFSERGLLLALDRSTAPGLGYGRIWYRGPAAVVSAPVFASFFFPSPVDQVPLQE